jgi:hypothetical protein
MFDEEDFCFLGADDVGIELGPILQASGGLISAGVEAAEKDKAEKAGAAAERTRIDTAVAADMAAANAIAKADVSAQLKQPSAAIDAQAAQMALSSSGRAGAVLSVEGQQKRADAARKALENAVKNAQDKPSDGFRQALVKAWTQVETAAQSSAISAGGRRQGGLDDYGKNWFVRPVLGKIPGWGVVAGGTGIAGALWFAVKKFLGR